MATWVWGGDGHLTVSLYTGAPLSFLITTAWERRDGDRIPGGSPQASLVAVALYVVMLISVGADGGPDGRGQKVTIHTLQSTYCMNTYHIMVHVD